MKLYDYNPETLEYTSSFYAQLDPLESEKQGKPIFSIPAHSTDKPPLESKEGYAVCFLGDTWKYFEDHRGETVYEKSTLRPVEIKTVGPISALYLKELPQADNIFQLWSGNGFIYMDLDIIKNKCKTLIEESYDKKLDKYYKVNNDYSINTKWIQMYTNLYVSMKADLEDGTLDDSYCIVVLDNSTGKTINLTISSIEEFKTYYRILRKNYKTCQQEYQQLIKDLEECTTSEEYVTRLQEYDPEIIKIKES